MKFAIIANLVKWKYECIRYLMSLNCVGVVILSN